MTLGQRIRTLREAAELSQEAVAGQAGITQEHLSNIERGERGASLDLTRRLAVALGVRWGDLIDPQ